MIVLLTCFTSNVYIWNSTFTKSKVYRVIGQKSFHLLTHDTPKAMYKTDASSQFKDRCFQSIEIAHKRRNNVKQCTSIQAIKQRRSTKDGSMTETNVIIVHFQITFIICHYLILHPSLNCQSGASVSWLHTSSHSV